MTKREFRHAVQRGLGSCFPALRDGEAARERFRPLILWACGRDTAYDAQARAARERTARGEPQTAEEIVRIVRALRGNAPPLSAYWAKRLWRQGKPEEVAKLADAYHAETEPRMRCALLRMLQYKEFAALLQLDALFADSRSGDEKLTYYAFNALEHQTCGRVRAYAYELLQGDTHTAQAVKLLAANYTDADRAALIDAVRRVPIRYGDLAWHSAFHNVMELFHAHKAHGLNELLPYFYQNTLCSFCRESVVKEMGRRHMLTPELLAEMQYDCNDDIRAYAAKRLRAAEQKTKRGNAPNERKPDE